MMRLVLLYVAVLFGPPAFAADVKEVVHQVQARYDATHDFSADVTQEMTIASVGKTTTMHGTVVFKKPGKMRWELHDGDSQIIVADGTTLWLYQPSEKEVIKTPFATAFHATTPISFLTGVGRIADDFDVSLTDDASDKALLTLTLVPRHDSDSIGGLKLMVSRDNYDIRGAAIRDPLGNVSRLVFENIQRNRSPSDELFVFKVPPGVDVIVPPTGQ